MITMLDRKVASIVLNGLAVFGGVLLGSGIKGLQDEVKLLKAKNKIYEIVIDGQKKIIESYNSKKDES